MILELCAICRTEFEMQKGEKSLKCKDCRELDLCYECEGENKTEDMISDDNGDLLCEECARPKCRFCNEPVEDEVLFCGKHCADGYHYDTYRDKFNEK
jgi:hypothetical protein